MDLTESALTFTTNHNIDFRNANVKFAFNSSNAGELYNINTLSIFSFENNGTVSANSINIETSLDNNSALNVNDIVVSTSASLINSGDIVTANLTLEKNAILENSNTLTATTISSVGTINNTGNLVTDTITTTILINTSDEILSEPNLTASNLHIVSLIENRVLITAGKFENTGYIKVNTSYSDDQYSTFNNDINATLDTTTAEVDSVATYIISEESQLLSNLDTIKRFVVNTDHTFDLSSDVISIKSYQYIDFGGASVIFADETSNAGTILNANEITVTGFTNSGTITTITLNISKSLINSSVINATGILVAEDAILTINKTLEADSIELAKNASLVNTGTVNCSTITSSGSIRNSGSLTSEKISTVILENSADEVLTEANLIVDNLTISSILESEEVLVNGSLSNTGYIKVNLSYSDDENSVVINEENAVIDRSTAQVNSLATNLTNNGTIIEPESL